jgi:hypothetical protein
MTESEKIKKQTEEFLAKGGKIEKVASNVMNSTYKRLTQVVSDEIQEYKDKKERNNDL